MNALKSVRSLALIGVLLLVTSVVLVRAFLINVDRGEIAILIRKVGKDLPNDLEIAPDETFKGVQREILTEGRHWRDPYHWDWRVIPQTVIENGKLGLRVSLTGDDLPYGEFLAKVDGQGEPTTKGIMPGVLKPGRYPINPYLFDVIEAEPQTIPAGYKGVTTNLAGKMPADPNALLVEEGERGVQKTVYDPGTLYLNPYEVRVNPLDCRSERFDLSQSGDMGFPSKDGFWVSLDGVIEFRVNPERAAEVYVLFNDDENSDIIHDELITKVILPKARSFCRLEGSNNLGREFIQGETRTQFQEDFEAAMRRECEPLGIEIIQALITRIRPPEQIAGPVRDREIAKQQERQYQQEIIQQESERQLAIEKALVLQKQAAVKADQEVVTVTTEAIREQEVAVTKANEQLAVAELKLEASRDEAAAIEARGKAAAEVVKFGNEADAAGWRTAVEAFDGSGAGYAQYVLYDKLSGAYRQMMVNTADSPIMKVFDAFADADAGGATKKAPRTTEVAGEAK